MRTLYYDIETDSEHPQYANMSLMGILVEDPKGFDDNVIYAWEAPFSAESIEEIKSLLCKQGIRRVGFNNLNYDDLVLANHGITVPSKGTEDAMLAIKTCHPELPAFALKFLCWYLLGDACWDEFTLEQSGHKFDGEVSENLRLYHREDLERHKKIWKWIEKKVAEPLHTEAYRLDMGMKYPLQEMTFEGGVLVDTKKAAQTLEMLEAKKKVIQARVAEVSNGKVTNANSNRQIGTYLADVEDFALNLTGTGEFQVKKKDLAEITGMENEKMREWKPGEILPPNFSEVALLGWQMKDNETIRKYVKNYLTAATETAMDGWIPAAYGISRAVTRRTLSKSFYKINFQNSNEAIDSFKLIPDGYLGWFIDSTQVENVVHIYESGDIARRQAYEEDEEWNEYVWLCCRIRGEEGDKAKWDSIKSKQVPHWSIYKLYKTVKLALNFGMGIKKFCATLGLDYKIGQAIFNDIHRACQAIRQLQDKVEANLNSIGYVQDSFGHIYRGEEPYKVVAYLIQGCGTGSLPKAQIKANFDTLHTWSANVGQSVGPLCSTTHDENSGLLRLNLGETKIHKILSELMVNMTSRYSHKFDGIPLRAKLYLSTTTVADKKNHEQINWKTQINIP
jgi:hypothetical protein